jgi:hypothetical protein
VACNAPFKAAGGAGHNKTSGTGVRYPSSGQPDHLIARRLKHLDSAATRITRIVGNEVRKSLGLPINKSDQNKKNNQLDRFIRREYLQCHRRIKQRPDGPPQLSFEFRNLCGEYDEFF